jgi:hypothetical protein
MIQVWARGSTFRVEKNQTARIKGIVSSSFPIQSAFGGLDVRPARNALKPVWSKFNQ